MNPRRLILREVIFYTDNDSDTPVFVRKQITLHVVII